MNIERTAISGTLESSDIMITVSPGNGTVVINLTSSVDLYYHDVMLQVMRTTLEEMGVDSVEIHAVDHGALDCTIKARLRTAIGRALKGGA